MQAAISLRHALATLAYRAAKVLPQAPPGFSDHRACETSRSAGQILSHLCDLMVWALAISAGQERWIDSKPTTWEEDSARFFAALAAFDDYLASGQEVHASPEKLFQGAIADSLTHVGQLAMLRRMAGAQVKGENYNVARIEVGRTGADQPAAVREFD